MKETIYKLSQYIQDFNLNVNESEYLRINKTTDFIFPEYSEMLIQKEEFKKITNENYESFNFLSIKFSIQFSQKLLVKIADFLMSENDEYSILKTICSTLVILKYLLWKQNPSLDTIEDVLHLLLLLIPTKIDCKHTETNPSKEKAKKNIYNYLYEPILYSIESCYDFYFSSEKIDLFNNFFSIFSSFFYTNPINANYLQQLLPSFLNTLIVSLKINKDTKKLPDEIIKYFNFLNNICKKKPIEILPKTSQEIIFKMISYIPLFHKSILTYLSYNSSFLTDDMQSLIISQLTTPFFELVESKPAQCYPTYYKSGEKIEDVLSLLEEQPKFNFPFTFTDSKLDAQFKFVNSNKTFQNGLNIFHMFDFSDKADLKKIIREDVYEILDIFILLLSNREPLQIAFFSEIAKKLQQYNPHFFDYCSLFIYIFKEIKNSHIFPLFWNTIFDTILFDERVNCYRLNKDFLLFDELRSLTFETIIASLDIKSTELSEMISSFSTRPQLIDEAVQRLASQLSNIPLQCLADSKFIQVISMLMLYFQSLNLQCEDKNSINLIEDTRTSLFHLVLKIFDRNKNTYESLLWMSNMFFLPTFISFVFEKPVRPLILNTIKNYIVTTNVNFYSGVLEKLEELCSLMSSRVPHEEETELVCDLLQIIIEFQIQKKREKIYYFKYLFAVIFNTLDFLTTNTKESMRYLSCVLLFFASFMENLLKEEQLKTISDTILRVENGKPSIALLPFLTHLLAGQRILSTNPSFLIKQPGVLNLILKVYINSDQFEEVFSFVKKLLGYSIFNVIISNSVKFDLLLVEVINSLKYDDTNEKKIIVLLDLLEYICSISCNKEIPMMLVSLLYPNKEKYLSQFELLFLRKITDIIINSSSMPNEWIPLSHLNKDNFFIKIKGFNRTNLPKRLLIISHIFLDLKGSQSQKKNKIFEIKHSTNSGLVAFISSGYLIIKYYNSLITSTAKISDPIPLATWTPISFLIEFPDNYEGSCATKTSSSTSELYNLSIKDDIKNSAKLNYKSANLFKQKNQSNFFVTPFIGPLKTRRINFILDPVLDGPYTIIIGNASLKNDENIPAAFLSSISFYDINNVKQDFNYSSSSSSPSSSTPSSPVSKFRSHFESVNSPILSISIKKGKNEKVSYNLTSTINGIVGETNGTGIDCHSTFNSGLREVDITMFLLPLFKLMDYPTKDKKEIKELPEHLFGLLSGTLEAIGEKQQLFKDRQGMVILSYILNNSNSFVLSYSTYIQIYSILASLIKPLQEDVISLFLLDRKNFVNSSLQNQLRLSKHWNRVLAEDYSNQIKSITPILVLIFEQFISDNITVRQIRENLFKIVNKISLIKLTKEDLLALISLPLSSPVEYWDTISIEVMSILSKLLKKEDSALYSLCSNDLKYLTLVNLYLQTATPENAIKLIKKLLKLVILMHKKNVFKGSNFISLEAHIEMLMREMPALFAQSDVILSIAHLCYQKGETSILPLLFFLASNCDDTALHELMIYITKSSFGQKSDPSEEQKYPNLSLHSNFWLIMAAVDAPRDVQEMILKYIMNCPSYDLLDTAIIIDTISRVREKSSSLLREHLIMSAQVLINESKECLQASSDEEFPIEEVSDKDSFYESRHSSNSSIFNESSNLMSSNNNLKGNAKNFLQIATHYLFFKREPLSSALLLAYEQSIFAAIERENLKEKRRENKRNRAKGMNKFSHLGSLDSMSNFSMKSPELKNTFSDLHSYISQSSKNTKNKYSPFSRSSSFHKLCLFTDDNDSSTSTTILDRSLLNSPKELYDSVEKYAKNLIFINSNTFNKSLISPNSILSSNEYDLFESYARAFGLKFDKNGNLSDHELAIKCLNLFELVVPFTQFFIPFDLMLCAFLVKKNRLAVEKHLKSLNLSQKNIKLNKNIINLLSKYLNSMNKQVPVCQWIPYSYDEMSASLAYEEMESKRSSLIEKREMKILQYFVEQNKISKREIKNALSIRRSTNMKPNGGNESNQDPNGNSISNPSKYVYFIETQVIELHSQEMIENMEAEKLWRNIENKLSSLYNFQ